MTTARKKTMAFGIINVFVVIVHNEQTPSDEDWRSWVEFNFKNVVEKTPVGRYLIVSEGGAPTSAQRKMLHESMAAPLSKDPTSIRTAVVTPSTFVRGVVTAMSWLDPIFRAFSPQDIASAYKYLGIPPDYHPDVERMIASLKAELQRSAAPP